jgi:hypothetical protein
VNSSEPFRKSDGLARSFIAVEIVTCGSGDFLGGGGEACTHRSLSVSRETRSNYSGILSLGPRLPPLCR